MIGSQKSLPSESLSVSNDEVPPMSPNSSRYELSEEFVPHCNLDTTDTTQSRNRNYPHIEVVAITDYVLD